MAAGLTANLNKSQIDQDFGSDLATLKNCLNRLKERYDTWWAPNGGTGYLALPGGATQGDADTLGSAITEAYNIYEIFYGNGTVASDGTVTIGSGGHNFSTFILRVCGDSVS